MPAAPRPRGPGPRGPRAVSRAWLRPVSQASLRGQAVTNRAGVTALATLAMLNVFTLGAGVAVAHILPARLALWQVPRVASAGLQAPAPVLAPASARGPVPSRGRLNALLAPLLATHALGQHVGAVVTD